VARGIGARVHNGLLYVFERRALYGVAAIDQQRVGVPGAGLADQGGDFGQAARHLSARGTRLPCRSVVASIVTVTCCASSTEAAQRRIGIRRRMESVPVYRIE